MIVVRALARGVFATLLALLPIAPLASTAEAQPITPEIRTSDVDAFYRVYDAAHGAPSAGQLQRGYLDHGSPALKKFSQSRIITSEKLASAIASKPAIFAGARRCAAVLPGVTRRLKAAFERLGQIYPQSSFPPVTVVIGRGKSGGTTNADGVVIGLETICAADYMDPDLESRFVHLIAHEYIHVQQPAAQTEPDHPALLFASLIEGGAELVGSLISGDVGNYQLKSWTRGHEGTIEAAFAKAEDSTDLQEWLWNGPGTPDHPGDLGYWVGYRIAKAYYDKAADKGQAVRDIVNVRNLADAKAILEASGWKPGQRP